MDISTLKAHLGDELFPQVESALQGVEGLSIIATNDGSWLPKSRLDAELGKQKEMRTTINQLTQQLAEAKKAGEGAATLQATIDSLNQQIQERDATITGMKRSGKIRDALLKANVRDAAVVEKLLDGGKIGEDDKGNLTGLDDQIKALKESSSYLFADEPSNRGGWGGGKNPKEAPKAESGNNDAMNNALRQMLGLVQG